jgi:hypothetical protein
MPNIIEKSTSVNVFTPKEELQKEYDALKGKVDIEKEELKTQLDMMEQQQKKLAEFLELYGTQGLEAIQNKKS